MNWHQRYLQQAGWTRELRKYIFERCSLPGARRVLEIGCGTGAVLADLPGGGPIPFGLDISRPALRECRQHAPAAHLTCADGAILPYPDDAFEITFCHYVLLWVKDPVRVLREMRRVTAPSGFVIAFAEPDYGSRNSHPAELEQLARLQNAALERQGAALRRGAELERNFRSAGIPLVETGILRREGPRAAVDSGWEDEWRVLEADLAETVSPADLARIKEIDRRAVALGEHALNVPTHFAWGQV